MEKKIRYKLHKVKKQWVTIAVTSLALVAGVGVGVASSTQQVSADEYAVTRGSDMPRTSESSSQTQTSSTDVDTQESSTEASSTVKEETNTETTTGDATQETTESSVEKAETTEASSEETQEKADSTEQSETTDVEDVADDSQKTSETDVRDDKTTKAAEEEQLSLDNIKKIDGKYYYVQEDGTVKKNFAITVNGQLLYFDAETGALSSTSTYSFTEGLTNLVDNFSKNNQAYDSTEKSFELVDGYLTANSWYRPTKVLENGEKWVDSTEDTYRPLVMAWWPDVDTQVNYLNHMSEYFGMGKKYSATDKQSTLNVAAEAIQIKIEQEIARRGNAAWLREIIASFVATQDKWNMNSEDRDTDHLQGGALLYVNSDLTEWANSDYRLLNRAPTLHRLGIQAFEPVLIDGKALRLHPLVCEAYNADFDGDQMAIHVPLSEEAQAEARLLMLAAEHILNPKDGKPVVTPSQDMVLGNYYLTMEEPGREGEGMVFKDRDEAVMAYRNGYVHLHTRVGITVDSMPNKPWTDEQKHKIMVTTVGKILFNDIMPDDLPYLQEPNNANLTEKTPDKYFLAPGQDIHTVIDSLDINVPFKKKNLGNIIAEIFKRFRTTETSAFLDRLKDLGYYHSTLAGLTVGIADIPVIDNKQEIIDAAHSKVEQINKAFRRGLMTDDDRYVAVTTTWREAKEELEQRLIETQDPKNPIVMMMDSGARGNISNFSQLAGMRGLMAAPNGRIMELPILSNFREGLSVLEMFFSTHGARKGMTDTALKTADSGYLTRRLVDVAQDVIIREDDCGTDRGLVISAITDGKEVTETLEERLVGRYTKKSVKHPENCYGVNLATGDAVEVGEAVGTIAAQSIGEPGTQLTMRTFHTGGVASNTDITQGLPRIQEIFEARNPKGEAVITEVKGTVVDIEEDASTRTKKVYVQGKTGMGEYVVPFTARMKVAVGDEVHRGAPLTEGSIQPKRLLEVRDTLSVETYLLAEVQKVYRSQGVEIGDKHVEVMVRQMLRKVRIMDPGDTDLLPGTLMDIADFTDANKDVVISGGIPATARPVLMGITKASLETNSFLSAASFQETTRVLTDAAIRGKKDHLLGLKENVIIGKIIPAGTGMARYRNLEPQAVNELETSEDAETVEASASTDAE